MEKNSSCCCNVFSKVICILFFVILLGILIQLYKIANKGIIVEQRYENPYKVEVVNSIDVK